MGVALVFLIGALVWAGLATGRANLNAKTAKTNAEAAKKSEIKAIAAKKEAESRADEARRKTVEVLTASATAAYVKGATSLSIHYLAGAINEVRDSEAAQATNRLRLSLIAGQSGRLKAILGQASRVAFSPDGKCLATMPMGRASEVQLFDTTTWSRIRTLESGAAGPAPLEFSPDGKLLATGGEDGNTARLWSTTTGKVVHPLNGHSGKVSLVAFSRDGKWVATGSDDRTVRLWDPATGGESKHTLPVQGGALHALTFSADSKWVATAADDGAPGYGR